MLGRGYLNTVIARVGFSVITLSALYSGSWACGGQSTSDPSIGGQHHVGGGGVVTSGSGGIAGESGGFAGSADGGVGGFPIPEITLGRSCVTDAECYGSGGLTCIKPNAPTFDGEGPAKGLCTFECSNNSSACEALWYVGAPAPSCIPMQNGASYCFEGCNLGPSTLEAFDPDKCHGRTEQACTATPEAPHPVCLPQCNADGDCGDGLFCNPRTGRCRATPISGEPIGTVCTTSGDDAGANACRGSCLALSHSEDPLPFTASCTESCTLGAVPSCGWSDPVTPAPAACLNGGLGIGDRGSCGQLCDDNCDCSNPDLVCTPWSGANAEDTKGFFQRNGYCADPLEPDGGLDAGIPCGSE